MSNQVINELCLVSREGVCILDMKKVVEKAKAIGCDALATLVQKDIDDNKITTGQYYPILATLYGVQS